MKIYERIEKTGNWLFRQRSYFPLLILPFLLLALKDSEYIERHFGNFVQTIWEILCITISFLGLIVRILTIGWIAEGTSGRNTKGQLAECLNVNGMYSMMRHPLYLGNFLIVLGFALFVEVWWFVVIFMLSFCLFYEQIIFAEEAFLEKKFTADYKRWADETPLVFPNFRKWKKPKRRFSLKMVLKREYSTFFGIIVGFVAIKFFADLLAEHELEMRKLWLVFLGIGFSVYVSFRAIRKKTNWLSTNRQ